jgi:hypothetical protein
MVLVGESPGVERRDVDGARGAREEELVTRSVDVDAERELLEPLGYGEGRDSDRVAWVGLAADMGGVRGRSSPRGRDMLRRGAGEVPCVDTARRPASFDTVRGSCVSEGGMAGILSSGFSEPTGEMFKGE